MREGGREYIILYIYQRRIIVERKKRILERGFLRVTENKVLGDLSGWGNRREGRAEDDYYNFNYNYVCS